MGTWANWLLVVLGLLSVIVELALGAITGFDLALVGGSLAAGGIIGLLAGSANTGLIAAAILALLYLFFFRRWLKSKLQVGDRLTNVDAVVGRTGVVTKRVAQREPGIVKVGTEEWRAELAPTDDVTREVGAVVTVSSVEGVTLRVR